MKIVYVTEYSRGQDRVWRYIGLVTESASAIAGEAIDWAIVPASTAKGSGAKLSIAELRALQPDLLRRIGAEDPDAVVTLGAPALNAVHGRVMKFRRAHGLMTWMDLDEGPVTLTPGVNPAAVIMKPELHRDFQAVIQKAVRQRAPLVPTAVDYHVPRDRADLEAALARLETASVIGVDVETTGLSGYSDSLLMLGLGAVTDDGTWGYAVVIDEDVLAAHGDIVWDAVWRRKRRSAGHNFKFDMQFMEPYIGMPPEGALIGDTLLLAHLLDERPGKVRARGNGLKDFVAQRYDYDYGFDFTGDGRYTEEQLADMRRYLADDVVYTARLWHDLSADAREEGSRALDLHDDFLTHVSRSVARAELVGAPVDVEWITETTRRLDRRIERRRDALLRALVSLAPTMIVSNLGSSKQVGDVIWGEWDVKPDMRRRFKVRTTAREIMTVVYEQLLRSGRPTDARRGRWIRAFLRYRSDVHTRTTYQKSMVQRLEAEPDGSMRLRASFLLHGAATGRISSEKPNLQNVPAVDERVVQPDGRVSYRLRDMSWTSRPMRRAFAPRDGYVWAEADYSQLELRVAAGLSRDTRFTDVFVQERDIHQEVASAVFGKAFEDVTKPERFMAKAVSFGIIYGRSPGALANGAEMDHYVEKMGGTRWTEDQARQFIRSFLRGFPELEDWMTKLATEVPTAGYVETPRGRRRRYPLKAKPGSSQEHAVQRQAVNTPVQAEASDVCLEAMVRVQRRIDDEGIRANVLFPVHDSICFEVHEDDVGDLEVLCRDVMEIDYFGVPLTVDFEWGPSWADVTKHKPQ